MSRWGPCHHGWLDASDGLAVQLTTLSTLMYQRGIWCSMNKAQHKQTFN
jgi:hypothetical protein